MTLLTVSVIVVSYGRPDSLDRCLKGIAQLDHPQFEVIIVADAAGRAVVPVGMKVVSFDKPNVSVARNLGIAEAAGAVVAFIDDDAVPEPTWLTFLCAPFADPEVAASGGFVIGRNGISFQWQARMAFSDGSAVPMRVDSDRPTVMQGEPGRAIKTEGTNMAFRKSRLVALGGFDPAFSFYLDETDVNMRLAAEAAKTAIVPRAQVHHGYAESARRTAGRVPRDLSGIARSLRIFLSKHDPKANPDAILRAERERQRRRLHSHMRDGGLMPGDVRKILHTFDAGLADESEHEMPVPDFAKTPVFLRYDGGYSDKKTRLITGRFWQRKRLFAQANEAVSAGQRVTVILLSFSPAYHRVYLHEDSYWVQNGGQFGKSVRTGRLFSLWGAKSRIRHEIARNSDIRKLVTGECYDQ